MSGLLTRRRAMMAGGKAAGPLLFEWIAGQPLPQWIEMITTSGASYSVTDAGIAINSGSTAWAHSDVKISLPVSTVGKRIKTTVNYKNVVSSSTNSSFAVFLGAGLEHGRTGRIHTQNSGAATLVVEQQNTNIAITNVWGTFAMSSGAVTIEETAQGTCKYYKDGVLKYTSASEFVPTSSSQWGVVCWVQKGSAGAVASAVITGIKIELLED